MQGDHRNILKSYQKFFKFKTSDFIQFKISGTCSRGTLHKIYERLQNSQQNCEQGHATTAVNNDLCLWHADKFQ